MSSCILRLFAVVLSVAALVSGCGGGGGGNSTSSTVTTMTTVTVSAPSSMPVIASTKLVDEYYDDIEFSGTISGNLDSLNGKTVFVLVEDPANLFQAEGYLIIQRLASGSTYILRLIGKQLKVAGHFTGNVRVRACLDAACTQPIAGTPLLLPYNVKVEAGLTVSRNEINVTVPFGTVPPPEMVDIGYSSLGKGWVANISSPYRTIVEEHTLSIGNTTYYYPYPTIGVLPRQGTILQDKQMQIQIYPSKPGNYFHTVRVSAVATSPGRELIFEQTVNVRYNVTPNPAINSLFYPATLDFMQKQQTSTMEYNYQLVTNIGIASEFVGIEYLSAAGTTGPVNSWWSEFPYRSAATCISNYYSGMSCLTPGVYTAQVRYRLITPKGTLGDVLYPIRMTVTGA
ncbi:hypothetical protein [Undibacterium flavidum]|uniref:DUF5689 domain-containing protein n=1 Tax=Undibacterium flavidum TaxID=2762297 RepID=A0ABR6YF29_9BURK|nr:hypothetical protein [Undibacterium flavidum]MBC3875153.1 hypothetical protein [Undibacterium flavidum]